MSVSGGERKLPHTETLQDHQSQSAAAEPDGGDEQYYEAVNVDQEILLGSAGPEENMTPFVSAEWRRLFFFNYAAGPRLTSTNNI